MFQPYTNQIPAQTNSHVVLTQPSHVKIQWPNPTGHTVPSNKPLNGFFAKIFG